MRPERRKDPYGKVLKEGEGFRKSDNLYTFRYKDVRGKIKAIYSYDLKELRKKEKAITDYLDEGIDYAAGEISVINLVEKYINKILSQ